MHLAMGSQRAWSVQELAALNAELDACDSLCLASHNEGTPKVLMEAMARGVPIVATNVGGIPDIVEDGVNGWLVPAEAPDQLLDAMQEVIENEGLRSAMAAANLHKAELFSVTAMTDAYETLYREITS